MKTKLTVTKRYENLKAAHRQWRHPGHCQLVHGENWAFEITFAASKPDECGFVVDFGKLRPLKEMLDSSFDHTLLIDHDDPQRDYFQQMNTLLLAKVIIVDSCSAEGLAQFVFVAATLFLDTPEFKKRKVRVTKVVCFEDNKNSATYIP